MMQNYCKEWLEKINFQSIDFNAFPIKQQKDYFFIEWIEGFEFALVYEKDKHCYFISPKGTIINGGLLILNQYKELFDKNKKIKSIIVPGIIAAYKNGNILSSSITENCLKNRHSSLNNQKMLYHYAEDIYKYNNRRINYKLAINYLTALLYNTRTNLRAISFYKGDFLVAWRHFLKKHKLGIKARNNINYKILRNGEKNGK